MNMNMIIYMQFMDRCVLNAMIWMVLHIFSMYWLVWLNYSFPSHFHIYTNTIIMIIIVDNYLAFVLHSLLDEYQSEVVQSNGRLVWAEGDDEKRIEEYLRGDVINGNDPHETALRMMPRLLAEKAMYMLIPHWFLIS